MVAYCVTGPGGLALRPQLWRAATLNVKHKRGSIAVQANFRFLFVWAQMGFLQEGLFTVRRHADLWSSVSPGQSSYNRGTEDPILLLHELTACRVSLGLSLWYAMGDYVRAFPRTIRADLFDLVSQDRKLTSGALALMGDFLEK